MKDQNEMRQLIGMICATAEAVGGQITPAAAALIASDLTGYSMDVIGLALAEVRRTARGRVTAGDILGAITRRDGRPAADEAWSIALKSLDESATVVISSEILQAVGIAQAVIDSGDMIAARRTFIVAYDRLLGEARDAGRPAAWTVSLGTDRSARALAIESAARIGRITQQKAAQYLQHAHGNEKPTPEGIALIGLITSNRPGETKEQMEARTRANLAVIREKLTRGRGERLDAERKAEREVRKVLSDRADRILGIGDGVMPDGRVVEP